MKKLLLIGATILTLTAKSQTSVYHPFPEDTASWVVDFVYSACNGYCGTTLYEMKGDTVINSQSYNKLYQRGGRFYYIVWPPNAVVGTDSFAACSYLGAIRQDSINKKVYFIDSTMTTDTLLYDFDLGVGDSIQSWYNKWSMPWPQVVTGIDSISINGSYRKQYHFQCCPGLIEGVGWFGDLFGINLFSGLSGMLACYNGNNAGGGMFVNECNALLNCDASSGVNEKEQETQLNVSPNPFTDILNLTFSSSEQLEIILYDISSRKLMQEKFTGTISLNTEQFSSGVYIYEVRSKTGMLKGKVVKQ